MHLSTDYLNTLFPLELMPVQAHSQGKGLGRVGSLRLIFEEEAEQELAARVVMLLGGWLEGLATPIAGKPACIHLAERIIKDHREEVPTQLFEALEQVQRVLVELTTKSLPELGQLATTGALDQHSCWLLQFYVETAQSSFDRYMGLPCYFFLADQSHKLAQHPEVKFSDFYQAKINPLLKLAAANFNWFETLPAFEEVACNPEQQELFFNQLHGYFKDVIANLELQGVMKLREEKLVHQITRVMKAIFSFSNSSQQHRFQTEFFSASVFASPQVATSVEKITLSPLAPAQGAGGKEATTANKAELLPNLPGATLLPLELLGPDVVQVRQNFDEISLLELAEDVAERGILEPLIVRPHSTQAGRYQIVAGERRYRAAFLAKLAQVPVIVKDLDDCEARLTGLVENIQRHDLDPLEEQRIFQTLHKHYNWSISEIARKVHKSRHYVLNRLQGTLEDFRASSEIEVLEDETTESEPIISHLEQSYSQENGAESEENHNLSRGDTLQNVQSSAKSGRLPTIGSFHRFGRMVNRLATALEAVGLEDEDCRQEWLEVLETLTIRLNRLKSCLEE